METIYNALSVEFIQALSWTLLHSLWQGLLIACLLSLFVKFSKTMSARNKYLISLASLTSLFIVSTATFFCYYDSPSASQGLELIVIGQLENTPTNLSTESAQVYNSISSYISEYSQMIVLTWIVGFVLFVFHILFGLYQLQKLKSRIIGLSEIWESRLTALSEKLNYSGKIILGQSDQIASPLTFGILKPVILFPIGMINQLSTQEVEAIMAHELAHIVRKDYLINFIQTLIEGIYYFNPGVWIISTIIRNQREHCCDDIAIAITGSSVHYLKALVAIEENKQDLNLAMAFSRNKKPLLQRVQRILKQPQKNSNMKEKLIMSGMFLIGLLLFTLDVNSKETASEVVDLNSEIEVSFEEMETTTSPIGEPTYLAKSEVVSKEILPRISLSTFDTIPAEDIELKYLDEEEQYLDVSDFEELIEDSDVKIIIEDGDISKMEIDGKDLSEEEITKIHYNLSEKERDELKENADVIIYKDEVNGDEDDDEFSSKRRRDIAQKKAEIIREKEELKREIRKNAESLKREKAQAKREISRERNNLRRNIEEAKREAREAIKNARSYSKLSLDDLDIDFDFDDIGEEIAMELEEVFEDLNFDLEDFNEEFVEEMHDLNIELNEEMQDFHEELAEEMEELQEELADMREDLQDGLSDIYIDIEDGEYLGTQELIEALESKLLADGLIDDTERYSFLLKKNKFQVNGEAMSSATRIDYERFFEDMTDNEWSDQSKLKIVRKGNSNYSEFILKN